jgi:hypothetical protein
MATARDRIGADVIAEALEARRDEAVLPWAATTLAGAVDRWGAPLAVARHDGQPQQ